MLQVPVFLNLNLILGQIDVTETVGHSVTHRDVWETGLGIKAIALVQKIVTRLFYYVEDGCVD